MTDRQKSRRGSASTSGGSPRGGGREEGEWDHSWDGWSGRKPPRVDDMETATSGGRQPRRRRPRGGQKHRKARAGRLAEGEPSSPCNRENDRMLKREMSSASVEQACQSKRRRPADKDRMNYRRWMDEQREQAARRGGAVGGFADESTASAAHAAMAGGEAGDSSVVCLGPRAGLRDVTRSPGRGGGRHGGGATGDGKGWWGRPPTSTRFEEVSSRGYVEAGRRAPGRDSPRRGDRRHAHAAPAESSVCYLGKDPPAGFHPRHRGPHSDEGIDRQQTVEGGGGRSDQRTGLPVREQPGSHQDFRGGVRAGASAGGGGDPRRGVFAAALNVQAGNDHGATVEVFARAQAMHVPSGAGPEGASVACHVSPGKVGGAGMQERTETTGRPKDAGGEANCEAAGVSCQTPIERERVGTSSARVGEAVRRGDDPAQFGGGVGDHGSGGEVDGAPGGQAGAASNQGDAAGGRVSTAAERWASFASRNMDALRAGLGRMRDADAAPTPPSAKAVSVEDSSFWDVGGGADVLARASHIMETTVAKAKGDRTAAALSGVSNAPHRAPFENKADLTGAIRRVTFAYCVTLRCLHGWVFASSNKLEGIQTADTYTRPDLARDLDEVVFEADDWGRQNASEAMFRRTISLGMECPLWFAGVTITNDPVDLNTTRLEDDYLQTLVRSFTEASTAALKSSEPRAKIAAVSECLRCVLAAVATVAMSARDASKSARDASFFAKAIGAPLLVACGHGWGRWEEHFQQCLQWGSQYWNIAPILVCPSVYHPRDLDVGVSFGTLCAGVDHPAGAIGWSWNGISRVRPAEASLIGVCHGCEVAIASVKGPQRRLETSRNGAGKDDADRDKHQQHEGATAGGDGGVEAEPSRQRCPGQVDSGVDAQQGEQELRRDPGGQAAAAARPSRVSTQAPPAPRPPAKRSAGRGGGRGRA